MFSVLFLLLVQVVFSDSGTLFVSSWFPFPRKTTRKLLMYLWFLAQKVINRLQHSMHGNTSRPTRTPCPQLEIDTLEMLRRNQQNPSASVHSSAKREKLLKTDSMHLQVPSNSMTWFL